MFVLGMVENGEEVLGTGGGVFAYPVRKPWLRIHKDIGFIRQETGSVHEGMP